MKPEPKPPLSPREVLLSLHLQADHDDAARATREASDEEIEEELRKAGFDLDRIDGVAPATKEPAKAKERPVAKVREARGRGTRVIPLRRSAIVWLAAAGIAATLFTGAGVLSVAGVFGPPAPEPTMSPSVPTIPAPQAPAPTELARVLRREAFEACGRGDFTACSAKLDEATHLDPGGDTDPKVLAARDAIVDFENGNAKQPPLEHRDAGGGR